jgi:hypothetical protein
MDITVNVTIPKEILSQKIVQDSIALVMVRKTAPEVKTLFRKTVFGWKHKPAFKQLLTRRANYMSERIWAEGGGVNSRGLSSADQYQMVNFGTPPHRIPKSGSTIMLFRWDGPGSYKASSRPGIIQSRRHSQSGTWRERWVVNHPGSEPRRFDLAIAKEYEPTFRKDIQDAISVAAAKTAQSNN